MPLPTLETPKYSLVIPSTNETIEYRPFLVKEEKILLIAQETNEEKDILNALKEIVKACTFDKVNPDSLTSFDLEYIFLKLRAKSVGEVSDVMCNCAKCQTPNEISINLDDIEVKWPEEKQNKVIMLTENIGVTMKYLSIKDLNTLDITSSKQAEAIIETIIAMIDNIFDEKTVYSSSQSSHEELVSFISSLNRIQMSKIENYINNLPKLQHNVSFECMSCKENNEITLSGTQAFFA